MNNQVCLLLVEDQTNHDYKYMYRKSNTWCFITLTEITSVCFVFADYPHHTHTVKVTFNLINQYSVCTSNCGVYVLYCTVVFWISTIYSIQSDFRGTLFTYKAHIANMQLSLPYQGDCQPRKDK